MDVSVENIELDEFLVGHPNLRLTRSDIAIVRELRVFVRLYRCEHMGPRFSYQLSVRGRTWRPITSAERCPDCEIQWLLKFGVCCGNCGGSILPGDSVYFCVPSIERGEKIFHMSNGWGSIVACFRNPKEGCGGDCFSVGHWNGKGVTGMKREVVKEGHYLHVTLSKALTEENLHALTL
jgi:hypothetical protein